MKNENEEVNLDIEQLENAILQSIEQNQDDKKKEVDLPSEVHIFPLLKRPFFPGMAAPIVIEPGPYYEALKTIAKSSFKFVGLFLTNEDNQDIYNLEPKNLYDVGVIAKILRIIPLDQGGAQVILNMEKRCKITKITHEGKILKTEVTIHTDKSSLSKELKAYAISIISTIKELLKLNPLFKEELQIFLGHSDFTEPGKLADFAVALTTASREELQDVLASFDIGSRIDKALVLLKKEIDLSVLQNSINQKIEATMTKNQKDLFLKQQLQTIKKELGLEKDDKLVDREKFEQRLKQRKVPKHVKEVIDEELEKLAVLEPQSAEYAVSRGYLDWLTILPWGIRTDECHDLTTAKRILEKDHYGLNDIKQRILEFIAVGKLTGGVRGNILCLVGPPGVGKTSIGKSISRALNRKFYRFSVGGMRDEAEIKGHRRTYIGAMPGKLIQALKITQSMNSVIMLDEVDKMGVSFQGDPASALLEVLDPEQNSEFLDHYLDVRCDLSDVLFIVTANMLDTIPEPLKDRMEILRLSGYIMQEKVEIAKKYLIPRNRKAVGLKATQVTFSTEGIRFLINGYAREAGVRTLENLIKKILRKIAMKIVESEQKKKRKKKALEEKEVTSYRITQKNLHEYLGKPIFTSEKFYKELPIGVCTGLAWTALGGVTLYIETVKVPAQKPEMKLTGQAGDVMKESSQIAWTYLQSAIEKYAPAIKFFPKSQVHIHIPEGATPKDGPSAGVTMVTALLSLLLDIPVLEDLAMTGELTITGHVLPIGGVKEKVVAAKRSGIKTIVFPKDNLRDYEELPDYVKKGLTARFVDHYDEIFRIAFPEYFAEEVSAHGKKQLVQKSLVRGIPKKKDPSARYRAKNR